MQFGIILRGHFPAGDDMAVRFRELCAQARLADRLGYASLTKSSHYAAAPLQDLQQIPFLARMAAEAPSLRLNAGVVLLSLHKPLDIAEQIATLDVMSGGRVIFGVALGYRPVDVRGQAHTVADGRHHVPVHMHLGGWRGVVHGGQVHRRPGRQCDTPPLQSAARGGNALERPNVKDRWRRQGRKHGPVRRPCYAVPQGSDAPARACSPKSHP